MGELKGWEEGSEGVETGIRNEGNSELQSIF